MRPIAIVVGPALLILAIAPWGRTPGAASDEGEERTILALEKAWADAGPARDVEAYERVLADDFIGQWADGSTSGKAATIDDLRTSRDAYSVVTLGPMNVRIFGETAVVNGRFSERSIVNGKDGSGEYSFTDVWVRRAGKWQCVALQSTRLAASAK